MFDHQIKNTEKRYRTLVSFLLSGEKSAVVFSGVFEGIKNRLAS
ncbi:hypothetical protein SC1083_0931 [Aggregatibacter actinomycetemcomitans serotype e str. SC1083]|uniref:Uncharacterized protein n=1 Tax=Aggregatibacter actinomycetemcomitans serotype e str. SC1083 TaxID=907488 RepID=G4A7Y5_AGGAC|nr:hypothetical protein SC1083_0931 [Aggregatibacter actinomycetemcomitans serotype e str. SC1083]